MTFTSIESIFQYITIDRTQFQKDDVLEFAAQAVETLRYKGHYERKGCLLEISNYKAHLPKGLWRIEVVAKVLPSYMNYKRDHMLTTVETDVTPETTTVTYETSLYNSQSLRQNTAQGPNVNRIYSILSQIVVNNVETVLGDPDTVKHFEILQMSNNPFTTNLHCDYSPNFNSCHNKYSISTSNELLTSFQEGYVFISYLSEPVDENGNILIPDDNDFKTAIASYVNMKYWEHRLHERDKMCLTYYQMYLNQWEKLAMKVKGKMYMQNIDTEQVIRMYNDRYKHIVGNQEVWHRNDGFRFTNYKIQTP